MSLLKAHLIIRSNNTDHLDRMFVDIVSDLHVDYWKEHQYDWKEHAKSDTVIVAGDVSDYLEEVVVELKKACEVYKDVLFVEGNHESSFCMNDMNHANMYINSNMSDYKNFHNLTNKSFIKDNIAFIGVCGWWDFEICKPDVSKETGIGCFDTAWNTLTNLSKEDIVNNIIESANRDALNIKKRVNELKNSYNICLVIHTVPHKELISKEYPVNKDYRSHYGNSQIQSILEKEDSIKYVVFGHNHDACLQTSYLSKMLINNARGRPKDYNRRQYYPLQICMN